VLFLRPAYTPTLTLTLYLGKDFAKSKTLNKSCTFFFHLNAVFFWLFKPTFLQ
jgi:hypothetical protein